MEIDKKEVIWEYFTADKVLSQEPCYVVQVIVTSDGVGAADITIINGYINTGEKRLVLKTADDTSNSADFPTHMYMSKGLCIDIGTNVIGVLAGYYKDK